jgi:hypothetical protein
VGLRGRVDLEQGVILVVGGDNLHPTQRLGPACRWEERGRHWGSRGVQLKTNGKIVISPSYLLPLGQIETTKALESRQSWVDGWVGATIFLVALKEFRTFTVASRELPLNLSMHSQLLQLSTTN